MPLDEDDIREVRDEISLGLLLLCPIALPLNAPQSRRRCVCLSLSTLNCRLPALRAAEGSTASLFSPHSTLNWRLSTSFVLSPL
jgi:hypothetical protein